MFRHGNCVQSSAMKIAVKNTCSIAFSNHTTPAVRDFNFIWKSKIRSPGTNARYAQATGTSDIFELFDDLESETLPNFTADRHAQLNRATCIHTSQDTRLFHPWLPHS